jgi:hypothetical protein
MKLNAKNYINAHFFLKKDLTINWKITRKDGILNSIEPNRLIQNSTNHLLAQAKSKKINSKLSKFDKIAGQNLLIF